MPTIHQKIKMEDKLEGNEIDLSLCNLISVPVDDLATFPAATHLDLSCNLIHSLPDSFCRLTHLVQIDLSQNQLTALPEEFGCLVSLERLDLRKNQLTTVPSSFRHLLSLVWLDLGSNPLHPVLREKAGPCLDERQCQTCAQKVILYMILKEKWSKGNQIQKRKKGPVERAVRQLLTMSFFTVVALLLIAGMATMGGCNIKDKLRDAVVPVCHSFRDGVFVTNRLFRHVLHLFSAIFCPRVLASVP
ncbi:Leucine-rich repeat-containing protein 59 [Nucella lapillus]